jgi:hypothetical protein
MVRRIIDILAHGGENGCPIAAMQSNSATTLLLLQLELHCAFVSGKDGGKFFLIDNIKILRPVIGDYIVDVLPFKIQSMV